MKLKNEIEYVFRILNYLSLQDRNRIVTSAEIAENENIPHLFSIRVLKKMEKKGLLKIFKGANGGYKLNKEPKDITLRDAVETIEDEIIIKDRACVVGPQLVTALEQSVVRTLADYGIEGYPKPDAPGVYIDGRKICSLGLRIRHGRSFHGLAFNINMDLSPFHQINPCGYAGLEMCQLADFIPAQDADCDKVSPQLVKHFAEQLGYNVTTC